MDILSNERLIMHSKKAFNMETRKHSTLTLLCLDRENSEEETGGGILRIRKENFPNG